MAKREGKEPTLLPPRFPSIVVPAEKVQHKRNGRTFLKPLRDSHRAVGGPSRAAPLFRDLFFQ